MTRKFFTQKEAEDFVREEFMYDGMGYGYRGRIVVKSYIIGTDDELNIVKEFSNKFGKRWLTLGAYYTTYHKEEPKLANSWRN